MDGLLLSFSFSSFLSLMLAFLLFHLTLLFTKYINYSILALVFQSFHYFHKDYVQILEVTDYLMSAVKSWCICEDEKAKCCNQGCGSCNQGENYWFPYLVVLAECHLCPL